MKIETENLILELVGSEQQGFNRELQELRQIYLKEEELLKENSDTFKDPYEEEFHQEYEKLLRQLQSDLLIQVSLKDSEKPIGMICLSCEDGKNIDAAYVFYDQEDRKKYSYESFESLLPSIMTNQEKFEVRTIS